MAAEIVVNFVVNKLCEAVLQEIFYLCGVKDKVERVKRELIRIQCFLRDADRKRGGDERVRNWVNELRDVSHCIEDTVDLFVQAVGYQRPGVKEKIKRILKKPEKLVATHKFGKEIDKILARIDEIAQSRVKYGIENLSESSESGDAQNFRRTIIPDLDETELVGVGAEKDKIVQQLLDGNVLRRCVVSVVGTGGLGKSTVAAKAYSSNEVKSKFDVRIWVSISQNFTLINLLKKILEGIRRLENDEKDMDEEHFMKEVNKCLREKKYLIVMDDVWSENLWTQIAPALPNVKNGSRILITSRFNNVPKAADPASEPYELRFLNQEESLELLLKTALPSKDPTEDFHTDMLDIAKQLAQKCDGLPLALVVLGGRLSIKQFTHYAWENVLRTMVWSVDGKNCMDILTTSYDDMPVELQSCFMYLACFPEDYTINAKDLIRLWVAEGLISPTSTITLEDTAENYLEQLVQRSMVQVLQRSPWGSIESCGLHDLMRDVAIQKAKEDNFLIVCSKGDVEQSGLTARRVAAHHADREVMKHVNSNVRSFLSFDSDAQNFSGHRLLKVCFEANQSGKIFITEIKSFKELTQLRYLKLDGYYGLTNEEYLTNLIGSMNILQTLDLRGLACFNVGLGDCIWHVKTLRHVLLLSGSTWAPPPSANLEYLQTLTGVKVPKSWKSTALPYLPSLRILELSVNYTSWEVVVAFLHTLENLKELSIIGESIPIEVVDMRSFPFYQRLMYLKFEGLCNEQMTQLDAVMFPTHLTVLVIDISDIWQDLMIALEKLHGLNKLTISDGCCANNTMRFSAGGFPHLKLLEIISTKLMELEIEEGAMPSLQNLIIRYPSDLQVPRGLQHLTALRNFTWIEIHYGVDPQDRVAKAQEIRDICKHVPSILIQLLGEDSI